MKAGSERTTIALRTHTRDRVKACATAEGATIDEFLARLLDEHEDRVFWQQMASAPALTPDEAAEVNAAFDTDTTDLEDL